MCSTNNKHAIHAIKVLFSLCTCSLLPTRNEMKQEEQCELFEVVVFTNGKHFQIVNQLF